MFIFKNSFFNCLPFTEESLRTLMFKRQKSAETQKACNFYLQNSTSLQISGKKSTKVTESICLIIIFAIEILDQLTEITGNRPSAAQENVLNKYLDH